MFPEPEPGPTTVVRSASKAGGEPAAQVLNLKDEREAAGIAADSSPESEGALHIRAALSMARSDENDERTPDPPRLQGTWIVKSLPRPPLVAAMLQEPPGDELLTNDSLGG